MDTSATSQDETDKTKCIHCGKYFSSEKGVNIHISRSHPDIHRANLVSRQQDKYGAGTTNALTPSTRSDRLICPSQLQNPNLTVFKSDLAKWKVKFKEISNNDTFSILKNDFIIFLAWSIHLFPGPKHPDCKFYEFGKNKKDLNIQRKHAESINPERQIKRDRIKRKAKYVYQFTHYQFYNQRRKAIGRILNTNGKQFKIPVRDIEDYLSRIYSIPNNCIRNTYPNSLSESERINLDQSYPLTKTKEEVNNVIKGIAVNTSPGPHHVLMRVVRDNSVPDIISLIATRMLMVLPASKKKPEQSCYISPETNYSLPTGGQLLSAQSWDEL